MPGEHVDSERVTPQSGHGASPVRLVAFDLDGTLLAPDSSLHPAEWEGLQRLGEAGIVRVVVTGRSLATAGQVLEPHTPIEYLIFSSGCGVIRWKDGQPMLQRRLSAPRGQEIADVLLGYNVPFMAQGLIPNNHEIYFWREDAALPTDFEQRLAHHQAHTYAIEEPSHIGARGLSQFVVPLPPDSPLVARLTQRLSACASVVQATSPFDGQSVWLEIFPKGVNKGLTLDWLRRKLGIAHRCTVAVGNDYNDESMLKASARAYVVANAPASLRARYEVIPSNAEHGCRKLMDALTGHHAGSPTLGL